MMPPYRSRLPFACTLAAAAVISLAGCKDKAAEKPPVAKPAAPSPTPAPTPSAPVLLASGVRYTDTHVGSGTGVAEGAPVRLRFAMRDVAGRALDEGELEFRAGDGHAIAGLDEAVRGMRPGGKRRIDVPASAAYGGGRGPIGPETSLILEVELLAADPN